MIRVTTVVKLKNGLHARPAALFVQEANKFNCDIFIEIDEKVANAKSIMGIMSLIINHDSQLVIIADGKDENQAADSLKSFLEKEQ
ncbi:MAG: HPr family phosphocarrier protein [Vulcanibacillus sp.]